MSLPVLSTSPQKAPRDIRILVVDDDPSIRKLVRLYLSDEGYQIHEAPGGVDTLELLETDSDWDLIILDIMMPDLDGRTVCAKIRERFHPFQLPILFLSALSEVEEIAEGLHTGANDYITKPFSKVELSARVKNLASLKYLYDLAVTHEQMAIHRSHHDELTGLPNKALLTIKLLDFLTIANIKGTALALYLINLDSFKSINDSLGHAVGDIYLKEISRVLNQTMTKADFLAHIHGDEFAVVRKDLHPDRLEEVEFFGQRLQHAVAQPISINQYTLQLTASVGVSVFPKDAQIVDDLLRNADTALMAAKKRGGNTVQLVDQQLTTMAATRLNMETMLRRALDQEEFLLYYQPQMSILDRRVSGAEALIRWQHPDGGLIPPGKFIPVAEESGLIIPMSEWILEKTARQIKHWQKMKLPPLKIGVNLSPVHFRIDNLAKSLDQLVSKLNLDPSIMDLEITESAIMSNLERAIQILNELREIGFNLSLDDFGTGYSSLSYLRRFPIHTLKIDQSFIRDLDQDEQNAAIVSTIINLAHSLDLKVIAEGVETENQLQYLTNTFCNEIQGFVLSRPIPAEQFPHFVQEYNSQTS
ncbi:MAG: EAL domain-containing response regulator [Candidatus Neomarinimicrobiota bacterium]|nr:MAG: EAL domain-containing response regulator [Candidatus Neomarinimicrobiota bacterium]